MDPGQVAVITDRTVEHEHSAALCWLPLAKQISRPPHQPSAGEAARYLPSAASRSTDGRDRPWLSGQSKSRPKEPRQDRGVRSGDDGGVAARPGSQRAPQVVKQRDRMRRLGEPGGTPAAGQQRAKAIDSAPARPDRRSGPGQPIAAPRRAGSPALPVAPGAGRPSQAAGRAWRCQRPARGVEHSRIWASGHRFADSLQRRRRAQRTRNRSGWALRDRAAGRARCVCRISERAAYSGSRPRSPASLKTASCRQPPSVMAPAGLRHGGQLIRRRHPDRARTPR